MYINCSGSCDITASGYKLKPEDAGKIVACPPEFTLGTKFYIHGVGEVRCEDRGGAIKGKRLDLWQGYGPDRVGQGTGIKKVYLIK
jgi:3D (Asp-Asp-Asp) domain-containing protein